VARDLHPYRAEYVTNPPAAQLRQLALSCTPAVFESAPGNLVKMSRNKARMAAYTYVIADPADSAEYSQKTITRADADALIATQTAYIENIGKLLEVRGYLGLGPRAVGVQWLYTPEAANIAGMQRVLAFPVEAVSDRTFEATFRVVYTPNLAAEGMPGGQAIIVDLVNSVTYIMGPDYFGESKKAALRMLNHQAFKKGALVLHAGAKEVRVNGSAMSMAILGLSGTGKTTTTFSKQGEVTRPIQDDMVTLWPGGELSITENGCFAKTYGLSEASEPVIYRGTLSADAWVENVYLDERGHYDFDKEWLTAAEVAHHRQVLIETGAPAANVDAYASGEVSRAQITDDSGVLLDGWEFARWTGNGRSIIPMSRIEDAADLTDIPPVRSMGILNRDEGTDAATPGIVRFTSPEQAAGYFMLGETTRTSAAGKEVGKTRSPFTQPFFPLAHSLQAERFSELAETMPQVSLWMMNTGYVAGDAASVAAGTAGRKVKIRHSSAMLEAMLTERVAWKRDPDFGYEIVDIEHPDSAWLLEHVPAEILDPARHYAATGRAADHRDWVVRMKRERRAFLEHFDVREDIIAAVCANS